MDNQNNNENDKLIEDILKSKRTVDDIKSQKKISQVGYKNKVYTIQTNGVQNLFLF